MSAARLDLQWARKPPARAVRGALMRGFFDPALRLWTRREVVGIEHCAALEGPVVFVANHASHMDTPLLHVALPKPYRGRTAVAAAADYFYAKRKNAYPASLVFNTVGIQRRGTGLDDDAGRRLAALFGSGWSLIVYPEGTRAKGTRVGRLRSGAAVMAAEHHLPLVPIHVEGTARAMPRGHKWMVRPRGGRHVIRVTFGAPILPGGEETRAEVMERVRVFFAACGSETTAPRARVEPPVPSRPAA